MVDDAMLRAMAQHRGLKLVKSRRRKPGGDFGRYGVADAKTGQECFGFGEDGLTATAEEVEQYLRSGELSSWKRSLKETGSQPRRSKTPPPRAHNDEDDREETAPAEEARRAEAPPEKPVPAPEPELEIRDFKKGDETSLASLLQVDAASIAAYAKAKQPLLVAALDEVVACVAWQVIRTPGGELGRITNLVVSERHRRRGVGTALLARAETELKRGGCGSIEAMSGIELESAHGFFRKLGYRESAYRFSKSAPPGA